MINCIFEDEGKAQLRHVTVNAVVVKDDKVLLGKRGTYNGGKVLSEAGKWALLGGFLNRDETVEEGLKREVKEESGWEVDNLKLLHIKDNPDRAREDRQNVEFVFIAEAKNKAGGRDEEVSELVWYLVKELPPKEQIAFDPGEDLEIYCRYIKDNLQLPVMGKYHSV